MNWKNVYRLNQCGICEKPVYWFHPSLSVKDEWAEAIWHRDCARDYDEWSLKITEKLIKPIISDYDPDMWARLESIQKKER
jgi:hypothetical protein